MIHLKKQQNRQPLPAWTTTVASTTFTRTRSWWRSITYGP